MGDRLDDLMTKLWPVLQKDVSAGIALKPEIAKYLPVDPRSDAKPYRLLSSEWDPNGPVPPTPPGASASIARFRTADAFEGALELAVQLDLSMNALDAGEDLHQAVKDFGIGARRFERGAILFRLGEQNPIRAYDEAAIRAATRRYGGPCRLIVKSKNETADKAKKRGLVDDVVDSEGQLPGGVEGLLLPLTGGPTVLRVVDDLTPSWQRNPNGSGIVLRISERLFLDRPTRAVRFMP